MKVTHRVRCGYVRILPQEVLDVGRLLVSSINGATKEEEGDLAGGGTAHTC